MWSKLAQRLTDPLFYRKRFMQISRPLRAARPPRAVGLDELLEKQGPVLVLIAHPDDELFCSGLLCELAARGREVHIACLTRGEGGATGGGSREALGRTREAELRDSAAVSAQIGELIRRTGPAFAVSHGSGGEYWHPAHLLVHRALFRAAGGRLPVLTIHAWQDGHALPGLLNRDDPADLVIDGSAYRDQRLAAFGAHCSQAGYFANHGGGSLEGYVDLTVREAYRHYPAWRG